MKRKFLLSAFLFASTLRGYAQDARGAMNQILDGYTLPIFAACMLVGLALGVAQQLDNIIDKENRGTRRDGLFALGCGFLPACGSRDNSGQSRNIRH